MAALRGLAVGDAFGSQFFVPANLPALVERTPPPPPWSWTDDTEMACSVVAVLARYGKIDQDALAASFAAHHDVERGYGPATNRMLRLVRDGEPWRDLARASFGGHGSWGNGAAMRVAPLGAWYADDLDRAAEQAALSAKVTHVHPEGVAGAVAVAVAAALAAGDGPRESGPFLDAVTAHVPVSGVRDGIRRARRLLSVCDPRTAAAALGNGREISAQDTVPFTLWVVGRHLDDFEAALWATARAGGDVDTTCAIVGGIVAVRVGVDRLPAAWSRACEPLPAWLNLALDGAGGSCV